MANPAPTINQINAFNATQGTTIDFNIIGGTELVRSNRIYIYDLSDNSLICTHLYVSTESIHELPANTDSSIVYESGKSSADFTNNTQYYAQIQTFTDVGGTQGGSGLSIAKLFWCLPTPTLTLSTIPTTISTTSYNVSATYAPNTSGSATNEIQEFQFNLYSAIGALLQTSGIVLYGEGVDLSYNFSGLEVDSTYYVTLDVTTTQGMNVSAQSNTFTVSIDTPTMGSASVVNNGCDGYISVTSNLSGGYEHEESVDSGEIISFTTDSVNNITELDVDFSPVQGGTPWMSTQNTEPYTFRAVPTQTEDFGHESDCIVGGTVAWNQLVQNGDFSSGTTAWNMQTPSLGSISASDNVLTHTITGGTQNPTWKYGVLQQNLQIFDRGHKFLSIAQIKPSVATSMRVELGGAVRKTTSVLPNSEFTTVAAIGNFASYNNHLLYYPESAVFNISAPAMTIQYKNVMVFDLTQMFGSTIADYIYSLEQATEGAGVAWFKNLFSNAYYPYDSGSLVSVSNLQSHDTTGKNLMPLVVGGEKNGVTAIVNDDGSVTLNGTASPQVARFYSESFTLKAGRYVITGKPTANSNYAIFLEGVSGSATEGAILTLKEDKTTMACVQVYKDGSVSNVTCYPMLRLASDSDTTYEPYEKNSYPLDSSLTLRGIPKLDANNNLYYDGDIYESDGTVTRKYGYKLFDGTNTTDGKIRFTEVSQATTADGTKYVAYLPNNYGAEQVIKQGGLAIATGYVWSSEILSSLHVGEFDTRATYTRFVLKDQTVTSLSALDDYFANNPMLFIYEVDTPTTQIADPYTNPQIVDPHGTEEYVGSPIPVGHKTTYQRICPISGWDSVGVVNHGINYFDKTTIVDNKYINTSGSEVGSNSYAHTDYIRVLPSTSYYTNASAGTYTVHYYDEFKHWLGRASLSSAGVFTTPNNAKFIIVNIQKSLVTADDLFVNYPSTDTTYHAYNGTTYTSTFPKYKQQVSQDKTPYITKNIGDTYADTLTENLVGGTVAWNQSVPDTTTTHTVSGSIASMDDAVAGNFESVVCDINPIQSLNGYSSPWAGGAGKNKLQVTATSQTVNDVTITVDANGVITLDGTATASANVVINQTSILADGTYIISGSDDGQSGARYYLRSTRGLVGSQNVALTYDSGQALYLYLHISSGAVMSASTDKIYPMIRLSSVTDATFAPYENICPISGHTEVDVVRTGKNLLPLPYTNTGGTTNGITYSVSSDGKITISNTATATAWVKLYGGFVSDSASIKKPVPSWIEADKTYTLSGGQSANVRLQINFYQGSTSIAEYKDEGSGVSFTPTSTLLSNADTMAVFLRIANGTTASGTISPMIRLSSTSANWTPFGTTYTTALGTTVYGGTLDVVSGNGEAWQMDDLSQLSATQPYTGSVNKTLAITLSATFNGYPLTEINMLSEQYKVQGYVIGQATLSNPDTKDCGIYWYRNSGDTTPTRIYIVLPLATSLSGKIVYEKSTPTTFTTTPTQVQTLLGTNNIFADSGDISVTYPTNHSYQSLSATHKYYKRINGVESISVGSDVVADVGTDNIIDLTQMFGTTIADYIYNREQSSSSGMGVKFFKSLFPNDDYDYNSGELISVNASAHIIKDANGNVLHTYPLDSDLVLRGMPKLDANNKLYYDGDVYEPNGSVTRKYGIVDLGTLTWGVPTSAGTSVCQNPPSNMNVYTTKPFGICNRILLVTSYSDRLITDGTIYSPGSNQLNVVKSSFGGTTAASVKSALSGVYLVYELATPTTESADPFEENQAIVPNGIEEYTVTEQGDVEMPVGHDSTYYTTKVYGGTIDMAKGVLTITHKSMTLDGTENGWQAYANGDGYAVSLSDMKPLNYGDGYASWLPVLKNINSLGCNFGHNNKYLYINHVNGIGTITDLTSWKAYLGNNNLQIVYELATPIEISLTPQQMQTLSGQNNIWSNTNGGMYLVYQLPITSLLVKRRDVADVSGKWLTLYSTPITQASDMDFTFIDFLNQYGKKYQYALVPVLAQNQSGVIVQIEGGYTVSDNVDSIFDGVYIADQTNVERVKAGVGYGNIDMNQGVGSITPIGSKYPIVITNSQNQYHNGSIRGTIVPNDFYSNGNLSRIDMVNKRDELEQFLTNKRAKIIKDWNGKMWLVMIMSNVNCSFNDNYGMGMVSFSADWLEVGDPTNQQDLYNAGLINVGGV